MMQTHVAMADDVQLVLFARFPVAGKCKTRLIPAVGAEKAASIHRHLTERTVNLLRESGAKVTVAVTGAPVSDFQEWLGDDLKFEVQAEGDLTDRLLAFVDCAPVIFFGADTPDLTAEDVQQAIDALRTSSVVIGPAEDGGYYLIGMKQPLPQLFADIPWSTEGVLKATQERLSALSIEPSLLRTLSDCDTPDDLAKWPNLIQ